MTNYVKLAGCVAATALAATFLIAQQEMKPGAGKTPTTHNSPILHPELAVEHGTYDAPAATLGEKMPASWSETTIAAGVNKNPQPGRHVEAVGEIVDFSCYLQLGKH